MDIPWAEWGADAVRLIVAGACGAVVGLEREYHEKGAGLRTHTLVCMGACLFSVAAVRMHRIYPTGDVMRVVNGLLVGIGFLAGGVIFTQRGSVKGLTTAAGLWVLCGVGLAAGLGYYFLVALGTGLTLLVVGGLKLLERAIRRSGGTPDEPDSVDGPGG